jgi:signal transduction histidine kinase
VSTQAIIAGLACALALSLLVLARVVIRGRRQQRVLEIQSQEIQKQLREINDQNARHEEILRQRQQLISIVSHDLKGPFNRIFALTQLMGMGEPLTEQQAVYLKHIHQLVADGLSMVRNMVDTRKLEGELELHPEEVSLPELIESLVQQFRVLAEKKKIAIHWQKPEPAHFQTDRAMLNRLLENLLSNAIKFSKEGKEIFVSARADSHGVAITIQDQAPGFTPEDQARMFKKFQKLSARPTAGETSTGLGLWIVKVLTERLGGRIELSTEPGRGSAFTLHLPEKIS